MIELEKLLHEHQDIEETPAWAEYLGIDIIKWPRARIIKLYMHTRTMFTQLMTELYERIDDLNKTIFYSEKLIKELEQKYTKERVAKRYYREEQTKLIKRIQELETQLENNKPTIN